MSPANRDRIYVALYARGGLEPHSYHRALIVGPKTEVEGSKGYRYHARQRLDPKEPGQQTWFYEALEVPLIQTSMLPARVLIGKVLDGPRLRRALERVTVVQRDPRWTCRACLRNAIAALAADGKCLGTSVIDWPKIEKAANDYVAMKRQQRRHDGSGKWKPGSVPKFDLLENKETSP